MAARFKELNAKTRLSETQYYTVEKINKDQVHLVNDAGEGLVVTADYVEKFLTASDQVDQEVTLSQTEIIQLFVASTNVVLTVCYRKKVDEKEVKKTLYSLYPNKGGKILSEADYKKKVEETLSDAIIGKERVMVGRHNGHLDEFGRMQFVDMEVERDLSKTEYDNRMKKVDPRTIEWMILRGVKYKVK